MEEGDSRSRRAAQVEKSVREERMSVEGSFALRVQSSPALEEENQEFGEVAGREVG